MKEILKQIQDYFIDDLQKCEQIASLELACRNILDWNQMRCLECMMKSDPQIYADLVKIIYRSEHDQEAVDEEKTKLVENLYYMYDEARFCPTEKNGEVNYTLLKEWIVKFQKILEDQGQKKLFDRLIGRLLPYSPIGNDGYMPCEAVRNIIEEYYSEGLVNSYIISEENKRGIYTPNAGKSEMLLSQKYKKNYEALQEDFPHTAEIYLELSRSYKSQADQERRRAEELC